ncbi:hypothetical protein [Streptomyces litchfieldiae]|uniref:Integral membrane protein n=1 Tax=Streptomyces litchfieldiae TaxID=3075543 RepID=A0ABU2MRD1_9ACTN|nr:hypothetical protein [Streptomyces sp. DSM 44938]MDT0344026.1 hypothetical protein [Streptomyces sp. DSM 44938]
MRHAEPGAARPLLVGLGLLLILLAGGAAWVRDPLEGGVFVLMALIPPTLLLALSCVYFSIHYLYADQPRWRFLTGGAAVGFLAGTACALLLAVAVICVSGPQLYQAAFGERSRAVIANVRYPSDQEGEPHGTVRYELRDAVTERDLGWMAFGPKEALTPGEHVEVYADPHGLAAPVAADRMGWLTVPALVLGAAATATAAAPTLAVAWQRRLVRRHGTLHDYFRHWHERRQR